MLALLRAVDGMVVDGKVVDGLAGSSSSRKKNMNTSEPKNKDDAAIRGEKGNAYENAWRQNLTR